MLSGHAVADAARRREVREGIEGHREAGGGPLTLALVGVAAPGARARARRLQQHCLSERNRLRLRPLPTPNTYPRRSRRLFTLPANHKTKSGSRRTDSKWKQNQRRDKKYSSETPFRTAPDPIGPERRCLAARSGWARTKRSVKVAAEQRGQVVGVMQRGPGHQAARGRRRGLRPARRGGRYLARQLRGEGGQPGRRQLAERRVRVLHQRLVRVRLPRPAACRTHALSRRSRQTPTPDTRGWARSPARNTCSCP